LPGLRRLVRDFVTGIDPVPGADPVTTGLGGEPCMIAVAFAGAGVVPETLRMVDGTFPDPWSLRDALRIGG